MIAAAKTKTSKIPRNKIARAVGLALPNGRTFELHVQKSALGGMKVVRVVTRAWKKLRPAERISRVREAVEHALSQEEQKEILRFSVLTPDEYKTIVKVPHHGSTARVATTIPKVAKRMAKKAAFRSRKSAGGSAKAQS